MVLAENLKNENIITSLKSTSRWELIEELMDIAVANNAIAEDASPVIKKALIDREKSMSTGIGNGVAIPHCTTNKIEEILIMMATSKKGIDFDAIDNHPVKIIILLIVPKNKLTQHIKTLANIAKLMSNSQLREKILSLKDPEAILTELQKFEKK